MVRIWQYIIVLKQVSRAAFQGNHDIMDNYSVIIIENLIRSFQILDGVPLNLAHQAINVVGTPNWHDRKDCQKVLWVKTKNKMKIRLINLLLTLS